MTPRSVWTIVASFTVGPAFGGLTWPKEAGGRVGTVLMFTLFGMALGGWMSGKVFDLTGSYHAAFINGIAWNLLNVSIASFLLFRTLRRSGGRVFALPAR